MVVLRGGNQTKESHFVSSKILLKKIREKDARVGIIGLGYVGLPLVREFCNAGFKVTGFDVDQQKIRHLNAGRSYIEHIPSSLIKKLLKQKLFSATADMRSLRKVDAIIICVPTPLTKTRDPDMTYILSTAEAIAANLRQGQLVVLESTTYPGTTEERPKRWSCRLSTRQV